MVRSAYTTCRLVFVIGSFLLFHFQSISPVKASEAEVGTYGASFLQIPVGPRLLASTEIVAGMSPDASIVFSNPASLSGVRVGQAFVTTSNWLGEMTMTAAGIVVPLPRNSMRLAFSTRLLHSGALKGYDDALNVVSEESVYDLGLSAALSQDFENIGLSLGLGVTYIREHIYPQDGNGIAFSLGVTYEVERNSFHFFAKDIGGKVSFNGYRYPIDGRIIFGYGRSLNLHQGNVNVGAQMTFTQADAKRLQLGGEYEFNRFFTLRTALNQYLESPTTSTFPLSGGMGFKFWNMAIDYAYTPHSYFPATHMFAFSYTFGRLPAPQEPDIQQPINTAPVFPSSPQAQSGVTSLKQEATKENSGKNEKIKNADKKANLETSQKAAEPRATKETELVTKVIEPASPPAPKKETKPEAEKKTPEQKTTYILLAGLHGRKESAFAEIHALKLLGIPATMDIFENRYRVKVGRYSSKKAAKSAAKSFEGKGYRFRIVEE